MSNEKEIQYSVDGEVSGFASPYDVKNINSPIVYAIGNESDGIVYVGQTSRPRDRMALYINNRSCHNPELSTWLGANQWGVAVLAVNPDDIDATEEMFIGKYWGKVFNKVKSTRLFHKGNEMYPWSASSGIRCPSDQLLRLMSFREKNSKTHKVVRSARKEMSTIDRCLFEIRAAMWVDKNLPMMSKPVAAWMKKAYPKMEVEMMKAMEGA